jgi:uncharacterized protein (DUF433 family)
MEWIYGRLFIAVSAFDPVDTIPLTTGKDGVVRVSGTRVTLDTIIAAFREGATPEGIAQQYSSVPLGDIYQVVGYFLRHSQELNAYLHRRMQESEAVKAENEQRWSPDGIRERLLARRTR